MWCDEKAVEEISPEGGRFPSLCEILEMNVAGNQERPKADDLLAGCSEGRRYHPKEGKQYQKSHEAQHQIREGTTGSKAQAPPFWSSPESDRAIHEMRSLECLMKLRFV